MRSKSSFSKDVEVLTEVEKPGGLKLDVEVITISSDAEEEEEPKPISKKPKSK